MSDIAKLREESKVKPQIIQKPIALRNKVIKRPMNINRHEPGILVPKASIPMGKAPSMGYQMRMKSNTMQPPMNDCEGATLAGTPGTEEYNSAYTKIFPDGMEPPILDQRTKRDRRLSSIIGVKTNGYGKDFDVEELMDPLRTDSFKLDNRKISMDFPASNIPSEGGVQENSVRRRKKSINANNLK